MRAVVLLTDVRRSDDCESVLTANNGHSIEDLRHFYRGRRYS